MYVLENIRQINIWTKDKRQIYLYFQHTAGICQFWPPTPQIEAV